MCHLCYSSSTFCVLLFYLSIPPYTSGFNGSKKQQMRMQWIHNGCFYQRQDIDRYYKRMIRSDCPKFYEKKYRRCDNNEVLGRAHTDGFCSQFIRFGVIVTNLMCEQIKILNANWYYLRGMYIDNRQSHTLPHCEFYVS